MRKNLITIYLGIIICNNIDEKKSHEVNRMLKEFRVENYKSIKDEQIFTMEACPKNEVSEYPEHVIEYNGERILKVSSMYGPNGGGKSNLLKAINTFCIIIINNMLLNDYINEENYFPCLFCKNKVTKFTWFFVREGYEIGYSLDVDLNKISPVLNTTTGNQNFIVDFHIVREELVARKLNENDFVSIYKRNENGVVESKVLNNIDLIKNGTLLNRNNSFVNYFCRSFTPESSREAKPLFVLFDELNSYVALNREANVYTYSKPMVELLAPILDRVKTHLNKLDFRIDGLFFKEMQGGFYSLYIRRKTSDGNYTEIPLRNESKGTIKAINIIMDVLSKSNAQVFIADDFDSYLHPKIIKMIVELFASEENKDKQLIMNSHDIVNMNNKIFRRDEIWFAYRNEEYSTIYIPLSNIVDYKGNMVRKDAVYGKQYLEGRYGADPFIGKGLSWNDD